MSHSVVRVHLTTRPSQMHLYWLSELRHLGFIQPDAEVCIPKMPEKVGPGLLKKMARHMMERVVVHRKKGKALEAILCLPESDFKNALVAAAWLANVIPMRMLLEEAFMKGRGATTRCRGYEQMGTRSDRERDYVKLQQAAKQAAGKRGESKPKPRRKKATKKC